MATYRCVIEYDGTDFCGWQFQPELRTACGSVEATLSRLFGEPIKVSAAGRTDAGVHATGQVISFRSDRAFPAERLALALNANLPPDVSARDAALVPDGFSARHHARERTYEYAILNRAEPSAPLRRFVHHVWKPIDAERFANAAGDLIGEHDFLAFCGVLPQKGGTVRRVRSVEMTRTNDIVRITIVGDGFLHRMVRISVGTLLEIAVGLRAVEDIPRIIASCERKEAGYTAPAAGLFLAGVRYDDFDSYRAAR
ncbi:MAG: tRNA pseudouridine(38-40) synthase TruA [Candidatus Velthaea sp.]